MTDIVQFVRDRLDEDEAVALGVSSGPHKPEVWEAKQWPYGKVPRDWAVDCPFGAVVVDGSFKGAAMHIARNDPARVLREVEAKRRIIELHTTGSYRTYQCSNGDHIQEWQCERAKEPYTEDRYCEVCGNECVEVPLLAGLYADHPDYDPAWRVE